MKIQPIIALTEACLPIGGHVYALVINFSTGGSYGQPSMHPRSLYYDGNDINGRPLFSEQILHVSGGLLSTNKTKKPYNYKIVDNKKIIDDNWIIVGILPGVAIGEKKPLLYNGKLQFLDNLKITPYIDESETIFDENN